MMGQGILEAGANIGRSIQQGYQSLGQGLASGINAAFEAYGDYKKLEAESKSSEKMFNNLAEGGYLPKEIAAKIKTDAEAMKGASALDRNAFWRDQKALLGGAVAQSYALEKARTEAMYNPAWSLYSEHANLLGAQAEEARARAKLAEGKVPQGSGFNFSARPGEVLPDGSVPGGTSIKPQAATPSQNTSLPLPSQTSGDDSSNAPYNWNDLSKAQDWLKQHGHNEASFNALPFNEQSFLINQRYNELLNSSPLKKKK